MVAPVAPESSAVRHREHDHAAAASFALFLMLMIALPALVYAAGVAGVGGGLLFLPLIVLLAGGSRHARRGFGPVGPTDVGDAVVGTGDGDLWRARDSLG